VKDLLGNEFQDFRVVHPTLGAVCATGGTFMVTRSGYSTLAVIIGIGEGWEHISVSLQKRVPVWEEMEFIKRLFFKDDETAMQLHVPPKDHINMHPFVLHMWRPVGDNIPLPPDYMV